MTHRHRVISSSCCDLSAEVARGQFSSRLYLQLSGFTINVPSLAQRKEDIPAFVNMMIPQYNTALAKSTVGMEPDAMELMVEFEWPLNLVQLEKVLRQMIAASSGFYITAAEVAAVLQNEMRKVSALPPAVDLSGTLEDIERRVIEQVLREENMNQSAAAKRLGNRRQRRKINKKVRGHREYPCAPGPNFRQRGSFTCLDSQRAADAAAGDAVYPIEHRRKHGDHRSTDGHAGHLAGGEAVIIEVHNHEVEGGDDCRAHDGGHKKHLGHLPFTDRNR